MSKPAKSIRSAKRVKKTKKVKMDEDIKGLDDDVSEICTLISGDEKKIQVPIDILTQSKLIKTMLDGESGSEEIPLPGVKASTLERIVKYMTYHKDKAPRKIEKPLKSRG